MKRITVLLALGASVAFLPSISRAAIPGGPHDFTNITTAGVTTNPGYTTFLWGGATAGTPGSTYVNPCQVCHIPHKAPDAGVTGAPLWNHHPSQNSSYVTYDQGNSATFKALGLTASLGSSYACLSCHDGSMAVNQSYTGASPNANGSSGAAPYYIPTFAVEAMQPGTEPANGAFVSASGSGPYTLRTDLTHMHPIGVSYTAALAVDNTLKSVSGIMNQMLKGPNKTVECASCHDIHGTIGASGTVSHTLIVDLNNAQLCETCHQQ